MQTKDCSYLCREWSLVGFTSQKKVVKNDGEAWESPVALQLAGEGELSGGAKPRAIGTTKITTADVRNNGCVSCFFLGSLT